MLCDDITPGHMLCDDITPGHMLCDDITPGHMLCDDITEHVPPVDEAWFCHAQLGDMYSRRKRDSYSLLLLVWVQLLLLQTVPPVGPEPVHRMKEIMSDKGGFHETKEHTSTPSTVGVH